MRVSVLGAIMAVAACGGGPAPSTAAAPPAASAVSKPALPSASASVPVSAPAVAASAPNPPSKDAPAAAAALPNVVDPPAPELARRLAEELRQLRQSSEADLLGRARGLPAPRDPNDNNPGSLVLSGIELAARELPVAVAHDRKHFAFVRREGETGTLWLAAIEGNHLQQLFDPKHDKAKLPEGRGLLPSAALFDVQFSADDRAIYFQSEEWATSAALYRLELGQRQPSFVIDANGYRVLSDCAKRPALNGSLIAYRHTRLLLALDGEPPTVGDRLIQSPEQHRIVTVGDHVQLDGFHFCLDQHSGSAREMAIFTVGSGSSLTRARPQPAARAPVPLAR
jgi:hypothetical protein